MAGSRIEVSGLPEIRKNLRNELKNIKGDVARGVRLALLWLKGKVLDVTPIEFGILRNSAFTDVEKTSDGVDGVIGFTADYAPHVHENTKANFNAPGTKAKFLEEPIIENSDGILQIIKQQAKR